METMRQATIAARSATHALQSVTAICLDLTQVDEILTDEQRSARSKLISDVLLSQKLTQLLKDRAEVLSGVLTKSRQRTGAQAC